MSTGGGKQRAFSSRIQGLSNSNLRHHAASTVRGTGGGGPQQGSQGRSSSVDLAGISSSVVMAGIARGGVVPAMVGQTREHAKARPMSSTPSVHTIVSEPEALDPIDYEEFVSQQSERDPLAQVLDFPDDDIEVNLVPRKIRTEEHVVPEEPYSQLDPTVQNCVDCYTSDWVVVNRKYQQYSSSLIMRDRGEEKVAVVQNTPRQQFECDDTPDPTPEFEDGDKSDRQSWASFDIRTAQPDEPVPGLLDKVDIEVMDTLNTNRRLDRRPESLFSLYPEQDEFDMLEKRTLAELPTETQGHRILVKCLELSLALQDIEPVFASMALYDARERRKVSENFYFDMNTEGVKKMLAGHLDHADISSHARTCVFDISTVPGDLFLVVKLEKVLQGDMSEAIEPYIKEERNVEKVRGGALDACKRLGQYRMPFCWTAIELAKIVRGIPLANESGSDVDSTGSNSLDRKSSQGNYDQWKRAEKTGSLTRRGSLDRKDKRSSWAASEPDLTASLDSFPPVTLTVSSFFKQEGDKLKDDDLYKHLQDLKKPSPKLKQLKSIKGSLKLDICVAGETVKHCLTPELAKLKPYIDPNARPTKEILNFPSKRRDITLENPHYQFRNLLYISPKELNFTNRSGERARNIAVKIQLMAGEGDDHSLPVIFGKSSCPEFSREVYTAVTYHNKTPDFYEEVKIKLPSNLKDHHHLLFTFYHITCKGQVKDEEKLSTPVGYTWIPLLEKGSLATGEHNLPVTSDLPPSGFSYIATDKAPPGSTGFKWIDNKKCIFNVEIEAISSVHTENAELDTFLSKTAGLQLGQKPARVADKDMEGDLVKCLKDVGKARPESLVSFLPLVLDKLLLLMVKPPTVAGLTLNVGQAAFSAMTSVVKVVSAHLSHRNDNHGRNSLLSTYITYQAHLPHLDPAISNYQHGRMPKGSSLPGRQGPFGEPGFMADDDEIRNIMRNFQSHQYGLDGTDGNLASRLGSDLGALAALGNASVGKLVHEQLALQLTLSKDSSRDSVLECSWFYFELMIKAMVEHLATANTLNAPRKHRFSDQFNDDILNMVASFTGEIISKHRKQGRITQLNSCLAFFLHDLLSVMDRGFVFSLIRTYMKEVTANITIMEPEHSSVLWELQIDFLRIISSHEHFIPLNLPQYGPAGFTSGSSSPTPSLRSIDSASSFISTMMGDRSSWAELSSEFRRQHFLVGLCLTNLFNALEQENGDVHTKSISIVRNLLTTHDLDPRYSEPDCRARVANLYLPVIGIIIDAVGALHGAAELQASRDDATTPIIDQITAQQIAGSAMFGTLESMRNTDMQNKPAKCSLSQENTRHLLATFLWVVKNVDNNVLKQWWSELPSERLHYLCEVLRITLTTFQYKGKHALKKARAQQIIRKPSDVKNQLEDMMLGGRNHAKDMMQRGASRKGAPPSPSIDGQGRRWNKNSFSSVPRTLPDSLDHAGQSLVWDPELEAHIEGNLATEVSMIVLDTLFVVEQVVSSTEHSQTLLASVLRVMLHALNTTQSTQFLQHLFALQRSLVSKYPNLLFDEATEHCAALCKSLLKHCSSSISGVRSQASASLYLLMRQNYEIGNNFARVKMQVTMSLSSLVAEISNNFKFNEEHLRKSLKTILTYAEQDNELSDSFNSFPEQVQDLVFNLHMILSDTVKMKEYLDDPEMHMDLMYRIAKGYQTSPDLRLTWLENMANKHKEQGHHAEAGMCLVHSAALVSEYLHMLEDRRYMPNGAVTYSKLTPNALDESAVSDDIVSPDEEGICNGKNFTENGLIEFLEHAAEEFTQGGMYEAVNEVYKPVIKIVEANRDFKKLAEIHKKLFKAFEKIESLQGKRVFGTYFRVGFYGRRFDDLDGEEFVYKEPMLTKLPEIACRLESFYGNKYGQDNLIIIKDSKQVELSKLNPDKAYIQITFAEPYFDNYELRDRVTAYERNHNICRFIFSTPFTSDGSPHGDLAEQYKRKTILTTVNHFPYIKTRIQVAQQKQIVLTPIEVAIEDIQMKVAKIDAAIKANDPKILQMELQGCIGTTVNQGPIEIARVFLRDLFDGKVPSKHENKLRLCFKELLKKSGDALKRNRQFIKKDQEAYQNQLEKSYHQCMEYLKPLIQPAPLPANQVARQGQSPARPSAGEMSVTSPLV